MQLVKLIDLNQFFPKKKKKKTKKEGRSVSQSDQYSFSSGTTSSSEDSTTSRKTPKTVLPGNDTWPSYTDKFDLLQAFKLIDKDNDGFIPKSELAALLSRLGAEPLSDDELATMLVEVGGGGCGEVEEEGCVSLEALASRLGSACEPARDEELRETFKFFDADRDGRITAEELLRVFREAILDEGCTLEECKRMIAEVDKNGDGFVCFEDFARMMFLQT